MIDFLSLLAIFAIDSPNPAIDRGGVLSFIESHRPKNAGPGKVVATASGHFDSDAHWDQLVVYSYENSSKSNHPGHGLYAVAFSTKQFETSEIVFIPAADIIPESVREYTADGKELTIRGKRHLPGDDDCCPRATASVTLWVANGEVVILRGEYRQDFDRH